MNLNLWVFFGHQYLQIGIHVMCNLDNENA